MIYLLNLFIFLLKGDILIYSTISFKKLRSLFWSNFAASFIFRVDWSILSSSSSLAMSSVDTGLISSTWLCEWESISLVVEGKSVCVIRLSLTRTNYITIIYSILGLRGIYTSLSNIGGKQVLWHYLYDL